MSIVKAMSDILQKVFINHNDITLNDYAKKKFLAFKTLVATAVMAIFVVKDGTMFFDGTSNDNFFLDGFNLNVLTQRTCCGQPC